MRGRRQRERNREALCDAMVDACTELGYLRVTEAIVATRAGLPEEAFREHFDDLEDCAYAVMQSQASAAAERVISAFAAQPQWRLAIRAAADALLGFVLEDLDRARFLTVEAEGAGERVKLLLDQQMQAFIMLIDQGRAEMEDPGALGPYTATAIGTAIFQRMQSALGSGQLEEFETSVPEMMYMVVLPYLGPEVAEEELERPVVSRMVKGVLERERQQRSRSLLTS